MFYKWRFKVSKKILTIFLIITFMIFHKNHEFLDYWCYNSKFSQCLIWYCGWLCYNCPSGSKIG